jgi:thiamine biosynthesis lipoprotein
VRRLEGIFTLYLADSAVSRLNGAGVLRAPPFELLEVLDAARTLTGLSHGAFDVHVQPFWTAHASRRWDELEPAMAALTGDITATATQIGLERPDMALTFNGIAQGYITDRVDALLVDDGFAEMFVDLGEMRATVRRAPGRRWRVRPAGATDAPAIELDRRAMAISEPAPGSKAVAPVHLLDPDEGEPPASPRRTTVVAMFVLRAGAASTAIAIRPHLAAELARRLGMINA